MPWRKRETIARVGPIEVTGVKRTKNPLDPDGSAKRAIRRFQIIMIRALRLRELHGALARILKRR